MIWINKELKIVITTFTYYPNNDGIQNVTEYQAEGLAALGYEVIVIVPSDKLDNIEEIYKGVKILRMPIGYKKHHVIGNVEAFIAALKKEANSATVMINVCLQNYVENIILGHIDEISCKKILYVHGAYEYTWSRNDFLSIKSIALKILMNAKYRLYYAINIKNICNYDEIIQIHPFDYATKYFEGHYNLKSEIIGNSVNDDFFIDSIHPPKYILNVSNYFENKNQEFLIEAFYKAHISSEIPLVLIGQRKTKYYEKLKKLKNKFDEEYGKRDVRLLVGITREKIPEYYHSAYIFLFSSKLEKCPICVMEAMASNVPFIATDAGCVRYNPGGIIIRNVAEMTYWIEQFTSNNDIRKEYGNAGKCFAESHFRTTTSINKLDSIIKTMI